MKDTEDMTLERRHREIHDKNLTQEPDSCAN